MITPSPASDLASDLNANWAAQLHRVAFLVFSTLAWLALGPRYHADILANG
jgi:hypothetical protein